MQQEEKQIIGIDSANLDGKIGPIVSAMVIVDSNFFRRFSWLKLKNLTTSEILKAVENTNKYVDDFFIEYIKPSEINNKDITNIFIKSLINLLNRKYRFWKYKIIINNRLDCSKEQFIENFIKSAPHNMDCDKLGIPKWILSGYKKRICMLAKIYAEYYSYLEQSTIKSIWGNFDDDIEKFIKDNPECPHIHAYLKNKKEVQNGKNDG